MLDIEVEVVSVADPGKGPGKGRDYLVTTRSAVGGTGPMPRSFPFDEHGLSNRLTVAALALIRSAAAACGLATPDDQQVQKFGAEMFGFLFGGEAGDHLAAVREQAAARAEPMGVRLRTSLPELTALPWEFLYDQARDEYLCLSGSLVRHIELGEARRSLAVTGPLHVLGMATSPAGSRPLDVEHERHLLAESLAPLINVQRVELGWVPGQTWQDLQRALRRRNWHVFHFIGHGWSDRTSGEGMLALSDSEGGLRQLPASDLALLLGGQPGLRLVVLNSCDSAKGTTVDLLSSTATALTRRGIPAVAAMQYEMSDDAAIAFSAGLYDAVTGGLEVGQAVTSARLDIKLARAGSMEWAVPVLYQRSMQSALFRCTPDDSETVAVTEAASQAGPSRGAPRAVLEHDTGVRAVRFSPDGMRLATGTDARAWVWDVRTGRVMTEFRHDFGWVWSVAFSPDGRLLATAGGDRTAGLWRLPDGRRLAALPHAALVGIVEFSPDGMLLATAGDDGMARIWNPVTGRELAQLEHGEAITALAFSPDGLLLATASGEEAARLWDCRDARLVRRLNHGGPVHDVAFHPDATLLATACGDGTARLWDTVTGAQTAVLPHHAAVTAVTFSPRNDILATAADDQQARIWRTPGADLVVTLGHGGQLRALAFGPDGSLLATAGDDRAARLWDIQGAIHEDNSASEPVAVLRHLGGVWAVTFSPDGRYLATGSDDGSARLWTVSAQPGPPD